MIKTIRVCKLGEEKDDYSWALKLSDDERLDLATRLLHDLWSAAHRSPFPTMNRSHVAYLRS